MFGVRKSRITLRIEQLVLAFLFSFASGSIFAANEGMKESNDGEIKVCITKKCVITRANSSLISEFLTESLQVSVGKSFKTCQYSVDNDNCVRSFISFESRGVGVVEGRSGFIGFTLRNPESSPPRQFNVDIDNYPWVFGTDLNEQNVKSASHQRCESSLLGIESSANSITLAIREYTCRGRVFSFKNNLLLNLKQIDIDTGRLIFSYHIDMRDGATGSGSGFTTLEFGKSMNQISSAVRFKELIVADTKPTISPSIGEFPKLDSKSAEGLNSSINVTKPSESDQQDTKRNSANKELGAQANPRKIEGKASAVNKASDKSTNVTKPKLTFEECYRQRYAEVSTANKKELQQSGHKGPYTEQDLVPSGVRRLIEEDCNSGTPKKTPEKELRVKNPLEL